jgi:hypothetical protein
MNHDSQLAQAQVFPLRLMQPTGTFTSDSAKIDATKHQGLVQ